MSQQSNGSGRFNVQLSEKKNTFGLCNRFASQIRHYDRSNTHFIVNIKNSRFSITIEYNANTWALRFLSAHKAHQIIHKNDGVKQAGVQFPLNEVFSIIWSFIEFNENFFHILYVLS